MTSFSLSRPSRPVEVLLRTTLALVGGYLLVRGLVSLCISVAVTLGADYERARLFAMMVAFLLYLAVFLWAFATRHLWRAIALLTGAAALTTFVAQLLVARLVSPG
jgi:hypothetical protein